MRCRRARQIKYECAVKIAKGFFFRIASNVGWAAAKYSAKSHFLESEQRQYEIESYDGWCFSSDLP
jgi:hypothetical protein